MSTRASSHFVGWLANRSLPKWLLQKIINKFVESYQINLAQYEKPIEAYTTFNDFFCRKLKPEFVHFQDGFCSPVEGTVSAFGEMDNFELQQIKGRNYKLAALLKDDNFGKLKSYMTVYLSPANYHRVHAPIDMEICKVKYISGQKYSTSQQQLERMDSVYCKNERIVLYGQYGTQKLILLMVGAVLVGNMGLSFTETPKPDSEIEFSSPFRIKKSEEIGFFKLGSTVVVLTDESVDFFNEVNQTIRLGAQLWN